MEQPPSTTTPGQGKLLPAALAVFGTASHLRIGYPLLLPPPDQGDLLHPLPDLLQGWLDEVPEGPSRQLLGDTLLRLEAGLAVANGAGTPDAGQRLREAIDAISERLSLSDEPATELREGLDGLLTRVPEGATLVGYGPAASRDVVLHVARRYQAEARIRLAAELAPLLAGIEDLLSVERSLDPSSREPGALTSSVGSAGARYLDAAALSGVVGRKRGSKASSPARIERLKGLHTRLTAALQDTTPQRTVVISAGGDSPWAAGDTGCEVLAHPEPLSQAWEAFERGVAARVELLRDVRVARLEIVGAYDAERHDRLVQSFGWADFSAQERRQVAPVVVVQGAEDVVVGGLSELCRLLAGPYPIQVVLERKGIGLLGVADPAMVGMASSSAFVQRSTPAQPDHLAAGVDRALSGDLAGLHVVFDGHLEGTGISPWLVAQAAVTCRSHALFQFDPSAGEGWDGMMDVSGNSDPEADWPAGGDDGVGFTVAHAAWLDPKLRSLLRHPADHETERLVPLADWLESPSLDTLPTIELWGPGGAEQRIADPELVRTVLGVRRAWRLLRELGGVANGYALAAAAKVRTEADAEAAAERERSEVAQAEAVAEALAEGASEAIGRLAASLLETDFTATPRARPAPTTPVVSEPVEEEEVAVEAAPAPVAEDDDDDEEAWIDAALCTSCNDCIDINPQLFGYDANKQAQILDPSAGTYEDMVKAAEKCPSRCIHPGAPLDPDEPGLEALLARAEKFR